MHWVLKRIVRTLFTVYAVITLSFVMIRFMPGGPIDFLRAQLIQRAGGGDLDQEARQRVEAMLEIYTNVNPSEPLWVQYTNYMSQMFQGDLGRSVWFSQPVGKILAEVVPWTVFLMTTGLILIFSHGVVLGALMAYYEGSRFDVWTTSLVTWLNGVPYYVMALVLLYILGYGWGLFPTGGRVGGVDPSRPFAFIHSALYHAVLPLLSLLVTGLGGYSLGMRGNSIQVLGTDYLRVARLRGLPAMRIGTLYVGRNAILPMYTSLMISIGFVFGGSVILETIFSYYGAGYYMLQAVNARDYPLMMGGFIIITLAVVTGIFIAEITYGLVDPRIRSKESS